MSSWGNSDSLASGGTITIGTAGVCTGSGTTFSTAGVTGGVISVGAGATYVAMGALVIVRARARLGGGWRVSDARR